MRIHWCGTGLSSGPGLRALLADGHPVTVWTQPVEQGQALVGDLTADIRPFDTGRLIAALARGDIVVSMLPADMHAELARHCVAHGAHFVCSSYATAELRSLDEAARHAGVSLVAEVGLDPGIDHLMAHDLIAAYRASPAYRSDNVLSFASYCGGVPRHPNAFRYKFSWSPYGVLKALSSPARYRRDFVDLRLAHPWDAVSAVTLPLSPPEAFEVYPNRDSLPYLAEYHFDPAWRVRDFVRGTLRLNGWAEAWSDIFAVLPGATDAELRELSDRLWRENAYAENEPDRVVLSVALTAERAGRPVWGRSWVLDAEGDARGSAMARLVSGTVRLAVGSLLQREIPVGLHTTPHEPRIVTRWLDETAHQTQVMSRVTLAG